MTNSSTYCRNCQYFYELTIPYDAHIIRRCESPKLVQFDRIKGPFSPEIDDELLRACDSLGAFKKKEPRE